MKTLMFGPEKGLDIYDLSYLISEDIQKVVDLSVTPFK